MLTFPVVPGKKCYDFMGDPVAVPQGSNWGATHVESVKIEGAICQGATFNVDGQGLVGDVTIAGPMLGNLVIKGSVRNIYLENTFNGIITVHGSVLGDITFGNAVSDPATLTVDGDVKGSVTFNNAVSGFKMHVGGTCSKPVAFKNSVSGSEVTGAGCGTATPPWEHAW